ncbi:MAG TPA: SCO family protein [Candidatus Baltobacteraceae bacterium]|jgi:protein SCO1/2|nr:SCO family protein [Candidatus Baltobacteraceae bacterium]
MHALILALAAMVIPVHGTVVGAGPNGTTIVRTDTVTATLPAQTRAFNVEPHITANAGTGVDAFLDRSHATWKLYDAHIAARFEPGLPETGKVFPIDYGSTLPHTSLVDQSGRLVDLATSFRGRVVLLAFIFTRCPDKDVCPTVSAKFAALSHQLDPKRFHLVEISLDPAYDSPAVLAQYAAHFGARGGMWSILTGQQQEVQHILDRFGISSLRVSDEAFLHNEKIFVTAPDGKVADIVQTAGFAPGALAAQAQHIAGLGSNPLERWKLAIVASAVALCGGSQFAGVVLLETVIFLIIAVLSFVTLGWVARKIWKRA